MRLKGITLIETVVYLALIGSVMLLIIRFGISFEELSRASRNNNEIQQLVIFLDSHLQETIENADLVNEDVSIFNDNNGILVLEIDGIEKRYLVMNGTLFFEDNEGAYAINSQKFSIDNFFIEEVRDELSKVSGVRITFGFNFRQNPNINETFRSLYLLK